MHRPRTHAVFAAALLFGLAASAPSRAQADPGTDAAAQVLYDQGTAAMDKGDYATGCPKLEEVVRLKPDGVGAKLTLAQCYEGARRLATAWAAYAAAESAAANAGQAERAKEAGAKVKALKGRLATVTVVVPKALRRAAGLEVRRDGVAVGESQWSIAVPVDSGSHVVAAKATGRTRWATRLEVKDGEALTVNAELGDAPVGADFKPGPTAPSEPPPAPVGAGFKPAPPFPAVAAGTSSVAAAPASPPAAAPSAEPAPSRSWVLPGIAIGAAVAGFGAMGVSAGLLSSTKSTIEAECPGKHCTQAGLDAVSTGQTLNVVGSVGFGVGVAGLAGLITWLVWPSSKAAPESARIAPAFAPGYAGLQLGRAF